MMWRLITGNKAVWDEYYSGSEARPPDLSHEEVLYVKRLGFTCWLHRALVGQYESAANDPEAQFTKNLNFEMILT